MSAPCADSQQRDVHPRIRGGGARAFAASVGAVATIAAVGAVAVAQPAWAGLSKTVWSGNGHAYQVVSGPSVTWTEAQTRSVAAGGHLATITSAAENQFVADLIQGTGVSPWIGVTDQSVEGTWTWVTGEPYVYSRWASGEPNNLNNEDYTHMLPGGSWNDLANDNFWYYTQRGYVVEWETGWDDKTPPTVTAAYDRSPLTIDGGKWFDGPVTVTWQATDNPGGSGVPAGNVPRPVTVTASGTVSSGPVCDAAGNCATATVEVNIDATAPTVTIGGVEPAGVYQLGRAKTPTCAAQDTGSGLAGPCTLTVTGGNANGVGAFTATATATDRVGHTATVTVTYKIVYGWQGFLPPITAPGHQLDPVGASFKAGSTVPVKFVLLDANGKPIRPVAAPVWLVPAKATAGGAPVASAAAFRFTDGQWVFTWNTTKAQAGSAWRIGVRLDDGQVYTITITLTGVPR